jgi:hypothetical protein
MTLQLRQYWLVPNKPDFPDCHVSTQRLLAVACALNHFVSLILLLLAKLSSQNSANRID